MIANTCVRGMLLLLLLLVDSCSLGMRGPDPAWDGKQKPECSDSYMPVVVDALSASVTASVVAQLVEQDQLPVDNEVLAGGVIISLIYTVSAAIGASRYRACRIATADWHAREAIAAASARDGGVSLPRPRYFCTLSPSRPELHVCLRERAACEHAREVLAVPDSEDCAPRDAAWCFNIDAKARCFATSYACQAQMARASTVSSTCSKRT